MTVLIALKFYFLDVKFDFDLTVQSIIIKVNIIAFWYNVKVCFFSFANSFTMRRKLQGTKMTLV